MKKSFLQIYSDHTYLLPYKETKKFDAIKPDIIKV